MRREDSRRADQQAVADALAGVARRDESALRRVYDATSSKLFAVCLRILGDKGEAEEVLQEVFITVWQRADSYDASRGAPMTWLTSMARNRAIDRLRSAARRRPAEQIETVLDLADSTPGPAALAESADEARRLGRCLDELEGRQKEVIRAAFFGGLTYAELASRDGVPLGTMKSWIRRALLQLRTCLSQ